MRSSFAEEIYGGVLFAVVSVMERRDGPRQLRDSDDNDDNK